MNDTPYNTTMIVTDSDQLNATSKNHVEEEKVDKAKLELAMQVLRET